MSYLLPGSPCMRRSSALGLAADPTSTIISQSPGPIDGRELHDEPHAERPPVRCSEGLRHDGRVAALEERLDVFWAGPSVSWTRRVFVCGRGSWHRVCDGRECSPQGCDANQREERARAHTSWTSCSAADGRKARKAQSKLFIVAGGIPAVDPGVRWAQRTPWVQHATRHLYYSEINHLVKSQDQAGAREGAPGETSTTTRAEKKRKPLPTICRQKAAHPLANSPHLHHAAFKNGDSTCCCP